MLGGRDRGHRLRPCVVEEVDIGIEREIEDMNAVDDLEISKLSDWRMWWLGLLWVCNI